MDARTPETRRRRGAIAALVTAALGTALVATASAATSPAAPARIDRVRYEADGTSTRVIIMLSRTVPYEVHVLGGESARHTERRLVLDFSNARLAPEAATPVGVENGLLQSIRTGQFTARTARVVLDLASITKHSVEGYDDPPRVVIDIAGNPAPPTVAAAAPEKAEPPAEQQAAVAPPKPSEPARRPEPPPVAEAPEPSPAPKAVERPPPPPEMPAAMRRAEVPAPTASPLPKLAEVPPAREPASTKSPASSEPIPGRQPSRPWRIVLDPGHGGADPGAQGVDGLLEKDVTLAIAQRLKRRLEESSNAKVLLTRETDTTRTLAERTAFANANSADLFVSIHANADRSGELQGIETYTLNNSNDRATIRLAKMENGPAVRVGRGDLSFILSDMVQSGKEEESNALA